MTTTPHPFVCIACAATTFDEDCPHVHQRLCCECDEHREDEGPEDDSHLIRELEMERSA